MWCFAICNSLYIELHLTCSIVCCTLPWHASLKWTCIILNCASCHVYACAFTMLFVSFWCCFLVPVMLRLWGFVRLLPFVFFMDSFFFLVESQARWSYPRNHFYLCLLVVISCLPYCHGKPLAHLPSTALFGYVSALLSPSYSVASCRWRWILFHDGTWICWDITISLI